MFATCFFYILLDFTFFSQNFNFYRIWSPPFCTYTPWDKQSLFIGYQSFQHDFLSWLLDYMNFYLLRSYLWLIIDLYLICWWAFFFNIWRNLTDWLTVYLIPLLDSDLSITCCSLDNTIRYHRNILNVICGVLLSWNMYNLDTYRL